MGSLHIANSMAKAAGRGAWAGDRATAEIWDLSKRELVEVALRLGASAAGVGDDFDAGLRAVKDEVIALRENRVI